MNLYIDEFYIWLDFDENFDENLKIFCFWK